MNLDGFRAGSGDQLVLLHGVWESWHSWSPVLDQLAAERQVLAPTLPGHRGSPALPDAIAPTVQAWADAVEAELDAAGFERPDVAGNSLGGALALELAARGRARTVVAVAPAGMWTRDEWRAFVRKCRRYHRAAQVGLPLARRLARTGWGRRLLLSENCVHPERIPPVEAERLLDEFVHCEVAAQLAANTREDGAMVPLGGLERVSCPVLILHPSGDRLMSREHAERFLAHVPHAEVRELLGCGHTAMFDEPELVAGEILRFTSANA